MSYVGGRSGERESVELQESLRGIESRYLLDKTALWYVELGHRLTGRLRNLRHRTNVDGERHTRALAVSQSASMCRVVQPGINHYAQDDEEMTYAYRVINEVRLLSMTTILTQSMHL
ncbi:hypothetical protein AB1N83_006531 [Pleurotus pulmonarius]